MNKSDYLRPPEAAEYVRLSTSTLAKMRVYGTGPSFIKAGARVVLYSIVALDEWLASRAFQNTSQYEQGGA